MPSRLRSIPLGLALAVALVACSSGAGSPDVPPADGGGSHDGSSSLLDSGIAPDGTASVDGAPNDAPVDLVQRLLALTSRCTVASNSQFSIHAGRPPTIDICKLNGAYFWSSSLNVDCDGQGTPECNASTDPAYQSNTSFHQASDGKPLIASVLPYVVIPLPSARFDYRAADIRPGALVIVIYNGKLTYGVFGDEGPVDLLGEASYAMAKSLGINPDPAVGGVDSGATYIVVTGASAAVSPIEDHQAAVSLGQTLANQLLAKN